MKKIDVEKMDAVPGRRLEPGDRFQFRCHPGIGCFNRCCRDLQLFLYPYDVLRLRSSLGIPSGQFLDEYVDVFLRPDSHFPEVMLRMADNSERTCPFLTADGCAVYPDRPDTCRTFPVEQGLVFEDGGRRTRVVHFFRPPPFCEGRNEPTEWTTETWADDQEAHRHNRMTARWAELRSRFQAGDPWGAEGPEGDKARMAFMAAYNLDAFRDFVFGSSFLKRYKVKPDQQRKLRRSDLELLEFGFEWIRFFVWGDRPSRFRAK